MILKYQFKPCDMLLYVLVVDFEEHQQYEIDEIVGDQVGVPDIVDDAVEYDVP